MKIVQNEELGPPTIMRAWPLVWSRVRSWWHINISLPLPRLVWVGDEIDISIRFKDIGNLGAPNYLSDVEDQLRAMGFRFDTGSGLDGRDWEWDWSLAGPVSLKFIGKARKTKARCPQPDPVKLNQIV